MTPQTARCAADKATSLRLRSTLLPILVRALSVHKLIDDLRNFKVSIMRVEKFMPGLHFIAHKSLLNLREPAGLLSKVVASMIQPGRSVTDFAQ